MVLWKTLHVLSMVTMVTVFIGAEIFYASAIRRRDMRALAWIQRTVEGAGAGWIGMGALAAGIGFGLLTAATGGFDFTAGWLIVAYVLVAAFLVNAALIGSKIVATAKQAMEAEASERPLEEVTGSLSANSGLLFVGINVVLFAAIIIDMVTRPF